ncbi:MEF2-activating motif and SAP domain-containing transcriptional regulator isoform X2 [Emydura macquarii macquarii]|uniref:MEF2-activating motif and SAP domain-containing transcriptional regulator isoform X2 n=1 Tax=Emydura macquarii macquarii TaxID=1129001 RepID=UPI00352B7FEB
MTLLASERSMLIRSKFRSVLQLRMQHRRSQEQHLLTPLTKPPTTYLDVKRTPEQSRADETLKLKVQTRTHKAGVAKDQFTDESGGDPSERKAKKTRLAEELKEKLLQRPGPLELVTKNILPLDTGLKDAVKADPAPAAPETFPFEEDLSSSSSSSSSSSPRFAHSPGGTLGNPSPASSSGAAFQPEPPSILGSQPPAAPAPDPISQPPGGGPPAKAPASLPKAPPRPKKAKDPKPKVRKLKYHQYVPPTARPPRAPAPLDAAYARLLQQQQLFLQLQILQQQQPPAPPGPPPALCLPALHPLSASISPDPVISFTAPPLPLTAPPTPPAPPVPPKPELLPANLDDLTVFCPPSCEPIGEDLELPLQITASPAPAPRSLEEELQEAIQKAQLVPSQSIEEILEEPLACPGDLLPADAPLLPPAEPCRPPSPLGQQGAPCKKPRCSSQVAPLPAAILDFPGHYDFLTPPSSSSSSPSDCLRGVFSPESPEGSPSPGPRPTFDPVDWLEALTAGPASGLGPGTPGGGSIFSTDFFDSPDLSVNHMIDLMVEQW